MTARTPEAAACGQRQWEDDMGDPEEDEAYTRLREAFVDPARRLVDAIGTIKRGRGRTEELAQIVAANRELAERGPRSIAGLDRNTANWMTTAAQYALLAAELGEELARLQAEVDELRAQVNDLRGTPSES
jgi:hypothetical protein